MTTGHRLFCKEFLSLNTMPCRSCPYLCTSERRREQRGNSRARYRRPIVSLACARRLHPAIQRIMYCAALTCARYMTLLIGNSDRTKSQMTSGQERANKCASGQLLKPPCYPQPCPSPIRGCTEGGLAQSDEIRARHLPKTCQTRQCGAARCVKRDATIKCDAIRCNTEQQGVTYYV